ncbi:3-phosphoserine/phosphohydroxythreonine transaminase [Corallococcus exiguus]|uniref:3-phosphoserine/phosphohydroxythreonine transaminase n=1 Tax=Corallococcus TaxID=83461 RepID=UPI000ED6C6BC|nr:MULTISPECIES: 3-phosphoserine/phosphohydroxythreonine transaminase [Corallococcus]NNB84696.1 3-phosphoserine/phosphohydroxythreonine transaminase [Corallococcus exiguus]NNB92581.1 3-phosphoserine/phosphohydroxythreonine transaminase [Corallococcus exiguus]NNC02954.1 3-phosphoserine/phosphohydroxythreonine transaminase [Corallococcus exiguus]NPC49772.1 3-phosphoserine/phosphohydroxythreonine transaminase [Corallococcus exiguus]RKH83869.1 3-phosphoserine/phosphohydroxythreonine transaminase [
MRVINFNPGPAGLPTAALERARDELLDFQGTGMSIIEHSHRGKAFEAVHNETLALVKELLAVPDTHEILFLQGGASQQFAQVPMNFMPQGGSADYVVTGGWSEKAVDETRYYGTPRIAANTVDKDKRFTRVPTQAELQLDPKAAYVHMTSNNTLFGTQWHTFPEVGQVPLVADMSSDILWKPIDVSRFALIYAGAQKNIGPSGIVLVLVEKSFMAKGRKDIPKIFRYTTYAENNSLYNTPPTFSIYLCRNVLAWIKGVGGLKQVEAWNREKGELLYTAIDRNAGFYRAPVEKASRSYMNVVFRLPDEKLEEAFVAEGAKAGMVGMKGHRITGGIRVSLYNAVTVDHVKTLVSFMDDFAKRNG